MNRPRWWWWKRMKFNNENLPLPAFDIFLARTLITDVYYDDITLMCLPYLLALQPALNTSIWRTMLGHVMFIFGSSLLQRWDPQSSAQPRSRRLCYDKYFYAKCFLSWKKDKRERERIEAIWECDLRLKSDFIQLFSSSIPWNFVCHKPGNLFPTKKSTQHETHWLICRKKAFNRKAAGKKLSERRGRREKWNDFRGEFLNSGEIESEA